MRTLISITSTLGALWLAACDTAGDEPVAADDQALGTSAPETDRPRRARHRAAFAERRKQFDANGDGKLDDAERQAMRAARTAAIFARLDANGDGAISKDEATGAGRRAARLLRDFDAVDADKDGGISQPELEAKMAQRRGKFGKRGKRRGPDVE